MDIEKKTENGMSTPIIFTIDGIKYESSLSGRLKLKDIKEIKK